MRFLFLALSVTVLSCVGAKSASAQNIRAFAGMQQQAAQQQAAQQQRTRAAQLRALHPAYASQPQSYSGATPGGSFGGGVSQMMQGSMGLGLSPGQSAPPSGVSGMMQGMGLGLPAGAAAVPGGIGGSLYGDAVPPYQGPNIGGPGPGNPGNESLEARGVGSSIPAGYVDESSASGGMPPPPPFPTEGPAAGAPPEGPPPGFGPSERPFAGGGEEGPHGSQPGEHGGQAPHPNERGELPGPLPPNERGEGPLPPSRPTEPGDGAVPPPPHPHERGENTGPPPPSNERPAASSPPPPPPPLLSPPPVKPAGSTFGGLPAFGVADTTGGAAFESAGTSRDVSFQTGKSAAAPLAEVSTRSRACAAAKSAGQPGWANAFTKIPGTVFIMDEPSTVQPGQIRLPRH